MLYDARIDNDKLLMTGLQGGFGNREMPVRVLSSLIGAVEEGIQGIEELGVYFKDEGMDLLTGLTIDDFKTNIPTLVEIESMSCLIPMEVMFPDDNLDQAGTDAFIQATFNDVATGKPSAHGYKIRALVNPAAVGSIEDNGAYRDIHLKAEFRTSCILHTALSLPQINAVLGLNGPA